MTELMADARSCDTNRLVTHILAYMPRDFTVTSGPPPVLVDKSKRGWNHNSTAAALCPLKLRTKFTLDVKSLTTLNSSA